MRRLSTKFRTVFLTKERENELIPMLREKTTAQNQVSVVWLKIGLFLWETNSMSFLGLLGCQKPDVTKQQKALFLHVAKILIEETPHAHSLALSPRYLLKGKRTPEPKGRKISLVSKRRTRSLLVRAFLF